MDKKKRNLDVEKATANLEVGVDIRNLRKVFSVSCLCVEASEIYSDENYSGIQNLQSESLSC